jgi:hypothetical protein
MLPSGTTAVFLKIYWRHLPGEKYNAVLAGNGL